MKMFFTGGHMVDNTSVYVFSKSLENIEEAHTIVTYREKLKEAEGLLLDWNVIGWQTLNGKLFLVGEDGETITINKIQIEEEGRITGNCIFTGSRKKRDIVAFGMDQCIKVSQNGVDWDNFNEDIDKDVYGILDLSSNDSDLSYCVCWDGEIFRTNGKKWEEVASPVNSILTSVLVQESGVFYVCGKDGALLKGTDDTVEVIDHSYGSEEFWDVFEHDGKIYFAASTTIFVYNGETIIPILGWYLPESGVYASMMKTPKGFWLFFEKTIYRYQDGEFTELPL